MFELETRKWLCRACRRSFWQRFPGIQPRLRATEPLRRSVCQKHFDGISRRRLGRRERVSSATIERWFRWYPGLLAGERINRKSPQILGIDEHFFTRRQGYATTFCDLKNHTVHDVVLGRSEASLEGYLARLEGKHLVQLLYMDLAATYRSLVRKHFPQARVVADRFHVIRTVNHQFLACWKQIQLGKTLHSWREEIACMWRFTRNNGITGGFQTKMEVLQRQAYGFRNVQNHRLRVKVMCS